MSCIESKHAVCTATHAMATFAQYADSLRLVGVGQKREYEYEINDEHDRRLKRRVFQLSTVYDCLDRCVNLYENGLIDNEIKLALSRAIVGILEPVPNTQSAVVMQQNTATPAKPVEVPAVAVRVVPELYSFLSALANGFADRIVENPTLMLDYADLQTRVVQYNIDGHVLKARDVWNFFEEEWFRGCCVKKTDRYPMKRSRERCVVQMNVQQAIKELKMYGKYDAAVKLP